MEQNLNLYHIFVTVARCKNISGAARALYISQPAISKAISRLEQNLNTTLFLRSSRGVKLTEAGEILYRQVESAFLAINQGEQQLKKMQELGIGHLSIGASSTLCKYVLLPYLRTFTEENPHIQISISCQSTYQTVQEMENGSVDIGLIGENSSPFLLLVVVFVLACVMTNFMSNTATTALLVPISISIAQGMGADPSAVVMATVIAGSCAYATPIGMPANTMVL